MAIHPRYFSVTNGNGLKRDQNKNRDMKKYSDRCGETKVAKVLHRESFSCKDKMGTHGLGFRCALLTLIFFTQASAYTFLECVV